MSSAIDRRQASVEADRQEAQHQKVLGRLGPDPEDPSEDPRNRWLRESLGKASLPVVGKPASLYRPPSFLAKATSSAEADALHSLLLEVKEANDQWVGESATVAKIMLNGSAEVRSVEAGLRHWAERYVAHRLAKGNPRRDKGNPTATYRRLYKELVPWLESLAFGNEQSTSVDTVHSTYLAEVCDHIPWLLFKGTWAPHLQTETREDAYRLQMDWPNERERAKCLYMARLYHWVGEDLLRRIVSARPLPLADGSEEEIRERLARLAGGIEEMRPFLVRGFRPERTIFKLKEGLWAAWYWVTDGRQIEIGLASSERRLLDGLNKQVLDLVTRVDADGILTNSFLPWLTTATQEGLGGDAWAVNLALVEAVHDQMLVWFDQIDVDAILASWAPSTGDAECDAEVGLADALDDEALAASIIRLASTDEEDALEEEVDAVRPERRPQHRRMSLRFTRLVSLLEDGLGCEVRSGKGSEVTIYREGGSIFTLGHHKRNDRVAWRQIRRLLKRVGIGLREWLDAAGP